MKITIFFILVVLVCVESSSTLKTFQIDGINYYLSYSARKNWYQAMRFCHQHGMYLLDPETPEENDNVVWYLRNNTETIPIRTYWLGATALGSDGEFYWWNSGSELRYSRFPPHQPDNAGGEEWCLELFELSNLEWNDAPCDILNYFICRATKYHKLDALASGNPSFVRPSIRL